MSTYLYSTAIRANANVNFKYAPIVLLSETKETLGCAFNQAAEPELHILNLISLNNAFLQRSVLFHISAFSFSAWIRY